MFCYNCGTKLADDALFCHECGTKIVVDVQEKVDISIENKEILAEESVVEISPQKTPVPDVIKSEQTDSEQEKTVGAQEETPEYPTDNQIIYEALKNNMTSCDKVKDVKYYTGKKSSFSIIKSFFNYYLCGLDPTTGIVNISVMVSWTYWVLAIPFVICNSLLFKCFIEETFSVILSLISISLSVLFILNLYFRNKEAEKVTLYAYSCIHDEFKCRIKFSKAQLVIAGIISVIFIVIGIIALFFAIPEAVSAGISEQGYNCEQSTSTDDYGSEFTKTDENIVSLIYENIEHDISFKYPDNWGVDTEISTSDESIVFLHPTDSAISYYAAMEVLCFYSYDYEYEYDTILSASVQDFKAEYVRNGIDDIEILDLEVVDIDGVSAKKIKSRYSNDYGEKVIEIIYMYGANDCIYNITFAASELFIDKYEPIFDAIIENYNIGNDQPIDMQSLEINADNLEEWEYAYIQKIQEISYQESQAKFNLIDLTSNEIPELLVEYSGCVGEVFVWNGNDIVSSIHFVYGAGGNLGYEYLPGEEIIRNFNQDAAGAIMNETYMTLTDTYEMIDIYDDALWYCYFNDINNNGMLDYEEDYCQEPHYYYGYTEISEAEYNAYQIPGEYEFIEGIYSANEMISQING